MRHWRSIAAGRIMASFIGLMSIGTACKGGTNGPGADALCSESLLPALSWDGALLSVAEESCGELALRPRVIGEGEWDIEFVQTERGSWEPVLSSPTGGVFQALVLEGAWALDGTTEAVLWKQGYQSWSWSGVTTPGEPTLDADGVILPGGDGDGPSVALETDSTSWWAGLVGRADGSSVLLGAESAFLTGFFMGLNGDEVQAVWGHRGESIAVEADELLVLDALWLGMGSDAQLLWEDYGDAAAVVSPPRGMDERPLTGWATWYQYYSEVTESDVRENLEVLIGLQNAEGEPPVDVFQIDDGWQLRWGDWWAGADFPSGMETLAADIAQAGMTPGLWMAPFYVSTESEAYIANPDWWVLDENNVPISFSNLDTGNYVILDVTHPDAAVWLSELITEKVDQGYHYLKLDFLYAGAMPGRRFGDVTGMEAYHIGMGILRESAGDAWILACGAPFLPSLGYAESFRTGADIAFEFNPDPRVAYYRWQTRSTAARAWTQGRWWWMDPDQIIIRDPLTEVEVRGALVSALIAGGTWMLGDDLSVLDEDRLALALRPALTEKLGQRITPYAPLERVSGMDGGPVIEALFPDDQLPVRWVMEDGSVVFLNLSDEPVELEGPGGTEIVTGEKSDPGLRMIAPGDGELWVP